MIITVCDTETTGLTSSDKVIQIAYVNVDTAQDFKIVKAYNQYIDHNISYMPEGAYKAHGITVEFLKQNGKKPVDVADETYVDLCHSIFAGYNVAFDVRMLESFFQSTFYSDFHVFKKLDVMLRKETLVNSLKRYKIRDSIISAIVNANFKSTFNKAHDASWDVIATYLLMRRCKDEIFGM